VSGRRPALSVGAAKDVAWTETTQAAVSRAENKRYSVTEKWGETWLRGDKSSCTNK
jgi:hypothetical protein